MPSARRVLAAVGRGADRQRSPEAATILGALPVPVVLLDAGRPVSLCEPRGRAVPRHLGLAAGPSSASDLLPPDNPIFLLIAQVRANEVTVSDHDLTLESPRLRKHGITVQGTPLPEEPGAVLLVFQDASAARALDRQLAFRGAARSVTGMAAILAHEVKNPLSGIRGAAQLLEASVRRAGSRADRADPGRGGPHPRAGRPDGDIRREADRPHRGEYPSRARTCAPARAKRFRRAYPFRRAVRSLASAGLGQSRPAGPGAAEPGEERGRGDHATPDPAHGEITLASGFQHGVRLAVPGSAVRVDLPLCRHRARQRSRNPRGHPPAFVRAVRQLQADRQRARACPGREDRRRSRRTDRGRQPARAGPNSGCTFLC